MDTALSGEWMWDGAVRAQEPGIVPDSTAPREKILAHLDLLTAAIDRLAPDYGGMGHNLQPAGEPLTTEERLAALEVVVRARVGVEAGDAKGLEAARSAWSSLGPIAETLRP